jgi:uncharacterized DUF497 family protein
MRGLGRRLPRKLITMGAMNRLAVTHFDSAHSISEQRFITVVLSSAQRVLLVVHTDRGENIDHRRRRAAPSEQRQYEGKN